MLAVAVSPDGALIATGDAAGQILLWHPQTRIAYAVLVGPARAVNGLAFAPDGTAVAAACGDGSVRVWRLDPELLDAVRQSARLLPDAQAELNRLLPAAARSIAPAVAPTVTLRAFGREGRCVAFSSDGRLLAAGGADHERAAGQPDGAAKVWRMADLWPNPADAALSGFAGLAAEQITRNRNGIRALKEVKDHLQPVCSVAFSPDGRTLATGSEDRGVILSQLNSDKREELRLHGGPVSALAFTRDGTTLATADNGENPVIVVWDLGKKRATERRKLIGHTGAVCGLAFSGDGRTLATVAALPDPTVRVWDVDTGTEAARLYGHRGTVHAVGWLPDRRTLVTASDDTTVRVWGTTARTNDTAVPFGDESAKVLAAALTPAGTTLATIDARSDVRLWAVDKLFAGRDAELPVFLTSGKPADNREWRVNGLALSADGSAVAVAAADGVRVWDLSAGRRVFGAAVLTVSPKGFAPGLEVRAVQFTPDGSQLVGLTATGVRVWDATTGEDETPEAWKAIRPPEAGGAVAVGPDGKTVAVSALGPNHEPGLVLADADGVGFARTPAQVTTLDFSPDGEQLAVGVWRHPGRVLHLTRDAGGWEATALCETAEPFSALRFCREGKTLLGVRANRELVLVDAATGVERAVLSGHADRIVGAGFSPRDQALVTVGRDGAVKRWNADPNSRVMLWETRPPRTAPTPAAPPAVVR
ncbi:MAG: WD40 repeat domain-containing protein [Fimbriiglobus sp.]|nr:WD40 repeat domain-containing protein [Fimbriiglobus sp.]